MKLFARKTLNGLVPLGSNDKYDAIPLGQDVEIEIKTPRNVAMHRKFFSLINVVYENQTTFKNIDHMRKELTKAAGFYESYINHKGEKCYEATSISFAKMDQSDFNDLYNRFIDTVIDIFEYEKNDLIKAIEGY